MRKVSSGVVLASQEKFVGYVNRLQELTSSLDFASSLVDRATGLIFLMQNCELVVPVVGAFSSGKSTMINTLLGEKILSVDIKPETALAMELHYSDESYLEGVVDSVSSDLEGGGGSKQVIRYGVEDLAKVKERADFYSYSRLFLNNERLKAIEPLIVVDMPGFDSPLEKHNKAILNYLSRGCHYLVLVSAEDGTLSRTLLDNLRGLKNNGRDFKLFLSKSDLRAASDIEKICEHIKDLLEDEFDEVHEIVGIDSRSAEAVFDAVKSLNPDGLFIGIFGNRVINICNDYLDNVNISLKSFQKGKEDLESIAMEMDESIGRLESKLNKDALNMQSVYSKMLFDSVISAIGDDLNNSSDELVSLLEKKDSARFNSRINKILSLSLMNTVGSELSVIHSRICDEFADSISGLDRIMREMAIDNSYIQNLKEKAQVSFNDVLGESEISKSGMNEAEIAKKVSDTASLFTPAISVVAKKVAPDISKKTSIPLEIVTVFLDVAVSVLPDILGWLFKPSEEEIRKNLKSQLEGDIFPRILREMRLKMPAELSRSVMQMIEQVKAQYEGFIAENRKSLQASYDQHQLDIKEKEEKIKGLEEIRSGLTEVLNKVIEMTGKESQYA